MSSFHALFLILSVTLVSCQQNIEAFGAIAGIDNHAQALSNGAAFTAALLAANASTSVGADRSVLIPGGKVYSYLPSGPGYNGIANVTIFFEGALNLSTANFSESYPGYPGSPYPPLSFSGCSNLKIISETDQGLLNGRGNEWWWATIFFGANRPNLLDVNSCSNFELTGVSFLNGPQFHVCISGSTDVLVQGVTVMVDIEDQLGVYGYVGGVEAARSKSPPEVLRAAGRIGPTLPEHQEVAQEAEMMRSATASPAFLAGMQERRRRSLPPPEIQAASWWEPAWSLTPPIPIIYALNTDGIDISGINVIVRNCSVTNFDDAICPKPQLGCSSNYDIHDNAITWGVGVSMGSVPPDVGNNCIANVVVRNVTFTSPLKAIYIKPNPEKFGENATGLITNITYEDITINDPVWWSIWIGTQQQHQPGDASGTGCSFVYPLWNSTCPTDPQVTVSNITLRNVQVYNSNSPGIILMNVSNPGTGFLFDNVVFHNISGFPIGNEYICVNTQGIATGGTFPVPPGFTVQ